LIEGCDPSSGTSYSQSIENARGSSKRRSPESVCYDKLLRENGPSSDRKSRKTVLIEGSVCYGKLLRDLPRGVLRRGYNLYYRHTVPVDAQRLLNRLESWRSLRTDSLAVAVRRLPSVVARIEMEIEHARAMAGLPVDATRRHIAATSTIRRALGPPTRGRFMRRALVCEDGSCRPERWPFVIVEIALRYVGVSNSVPRRRQTPTRSFFD
jgi:hypothetical protein